MALHLADRWVWDFWFAQDGPDYHLFYLQADRSLKQEELRHKHVSVGHAVSQDLRQWEVLPDALAPSPYEPGTPDEPFDSYTTWTGSIIRHAGLWYMFYTGGKRSEDALVQRVGLATSSDLMTWEKHDGNPVITADPAWYEMLDLDAWHDHAWRDPYVFQHPQTGDFHAFITARAKDGPEDARGVIGHARSRDLLHWEVLPPVSEPGEFGHMEVPQVVPIGDQWALLFSVLSPQWSKARLTRLNGRHESGTHYLLADDILGPYHLPDDAFLQGDAHGSLYSGKLVHLPDGSLAFMAFENMTPDGEFLGNLTDPIPVRAGPVGRLSLEEA